MPPSEASFGAGAANPLVVNPILPNPVASPAGGFLYRYEAGIADNEKLRSDFGTASNTAPDFFILHDFAGYIGGSIAVTGPAAGSWTAVAELTSTPVVGIAPVDDPILFNLRFNFISLAQLVGPATTFQFEARSIGGTPSSLNTFTGATTKNAVGAGDDNANVATISTYSGPDASRAAAIPEPGTLTLVGLGLLPLAGAFIRRRK